MDWLGAVVRFVVSALVLMLVGLIVPGFGTLGFWQALLAAIVIAAMGWVVKASSGETSLPTPRDSWLLGVCAVIWAAQFSCQRCPYPSSVRSSAPCHWGY